MGRKIQKIIVLFFVFFLLLIGGCKENKNQNVHVNVKQQEELIELTLDSKKIEDFIRDFKEEIERYIVEERTEIYENYNISWKYYTIYFKNSYPIYFVLDKLASKNLVFEKNKNSNLSYEKYQFFDNIYISGKGKKLVNILTLYFPIRVKKKSIGNLPKVAFVVDDVVEDNYWTERLLNFTYTLNIAIIPTRKTKEIAEKVAQKGWEVMMHLPMESISYPKDARYLVSEAIMVGMDDKEIEEILKVHLSRFGNIKVKWINNHMGSKVTKDVDTMERIIRIFKKYNLCFLDSRTTNNTVGVKIANKVGIPSFENMLFIDHESEIEKIKQRFYQAVNIAKKKGWGVFIFHLRPNTIKVLEELEKENFFSDIELIKISDLFEEVNIQPLAQPQEFQSKFSH